MELYLTFNGTIGRLKFFLAHIGLILIAFCVATLLMLVLPEVLPRTYRAVQTLPLVLEPHPQPFLAFLDFSFGLIGMIASTALISKRMGWNGTNAVVSWIFVISQGAVIVLQTMSRLTWPQTELQLFFSIILTGAFVVACIVPGKQPGDDFDLERMAAKVEAEVRERYG